MRINIEKIPNKKAFEPEKHFGFNPFMEKLNIASAILDIGVGRKINLYFDLRGNFKVTSGRREYCSEGCEENQNWNFKSTTIIPKKSEGDWAKYASEDLIYEIVEKMEVYARKRNSHYEQRKT